MFLVVLLKKYQKIKSEVTRSFYFYYFIFIFNRYLLFYTIFKHRFFLLTVVSDCGHWTVLWQFYTRVFGSAPSHVIVLFTFYISHHLCNLHCCFLNSYIILKTAIAS